ncbi:hypothetical protein AGABI2DRAFT_147857 [Agaricus bisporus var. bisporus H97]|uniref:hypothetical protein n=1 Tax=Agaricus bisporus var. bisporus (strain H97 / ATCC MYA-4626 / FGSC 10389) TaxID=936046 RepID=UPI00029F5455|nr:hypothetical protein AGABI2DRAFT_147857 [Agaricus bisporus var. bisporus H97]EKV51517.1 hypothetical protein AGABI2DRAFT_147857 [Agaricus bisporus var. bisporus H97]
MADQLDPTTQRELAHFIEQEQNQARLQSSIHRLTSTCWDKCITGSVGNSFSRSEEACLANCVQRFMDTTHYLMDEIQNKRGSR